MPPAHRHSAPGDEERLRSGIRTCTLLFIGGLVISGATAIPISAECDFGAALFGEDFAAGGTVPPRVAAWLRTVRGAVEMTASQAPFMFYGTDWLAFGHFVIALAFVGALRDPIRNRWLYQFGMVACALVPVWALVFGHIRGIPFWWRMIDAAFGVIGFLPMWLCNRWVDRLEVADARK